MKGDGNAGGRDAARWLTASASALLTAQAVAQDGDAEASYRLSRYEEDGMKPRDVALGSTDRYGISTQQLNVFVPLQGRWAVELNALHETMSGASPYYNILGPDGVRVVMSGASIRDERDDLAVTGRYDGDATDIAVTAGRSVEDDYDANYGSVSLARGFNLDNTVVSVTVGATSDDLAPTDAALFDRIPAADKSGRSVFIGLSQVLGPDWVVQGGVGFNRLEGYLTDPYKAGDVDAPLENRPDSRRQRTLALRSRYYVHAWDAALRSDYRYFNDDWGVDSHTLTVGIEKNLGEDFSLSLDARYYTQDAADFYVPYLTGTELPPDFYATDYRLSGFGALSVDVGAGWQVSEDWRVVGVVERYIADDAYGVDDDALVNPAWTRYWRVSIGIDARF